MVWSADSSFLFWVQALRAPGAFASPIEVQARDEHTAAPPLSLDSAGGSQASSRTLSPEKHSFHLGSSFWAQL